MVPTFGHAPTTKPTPARVHTAHRALILMFALLGVFLTTFLSRIPTIRDLLHVSSSGLAILLLFGALGALVALVVAGWANAKFGSRALLWWVSFAHLVSLVVLGLSTAIGSPVLFASALFLMNLAFALSNVPANAEAADVERRVGRSIMPQFHAGFSVGMAVGIALGAAASHWHVAPVWHFAIVAVAATIVRLVVIPVAVLDGTPDPRVASKSLGGPFATAGAEYRNRRVLLIGAIVFAAAMTEMIASQWLSLAVVDDFGQREATGDIIYWVFVASMFSFRMSGAGIIDRLGRVVTLRASAVSVVIGVTLFAFTPTFWLVPVAVIFWGAGAALNFPIGFTAAADDPRHAAARVAAVSSFSTTAGLIVPQIIGRMAEWVPLRHAMLLVLVGSLAAFILARAVRSDRHIFRSRRAVERAVGSELLERQMTDPSAVLDAAGEAIPMHRGDKRSRLR
ncbi:MAG: MFS transporter [Demequina sp.]|uniref:MFS transporter n=1 Tax=Demequina sp. TaxID=2050685 RepID=UPI00199DFD7A|nr:MFS transporter [Demequina sp.]MBC7297552.1 MFS transporter [Demequina sp.]